MPKEGARGGTLGSPALVGKGLDAEEAPLQVGIAEQLACRRLGSDLAADHDQLALGEGRGDAEVLLDQENPQTLPLEPAEDLDQILDDRRRQASDGSSMISSFGFVRSARAIASICCS